MYSKILAFTGGACPGDYGIYNCGCLSGVAAWCSFSPTGFALVAALVNLSSYFRKKRASLLEREKMMRKERKNMYKTAKTFVACDSTNTPYQVGRDKPGPGFYEEHDFSDSELDKGEAKYSEHWYEKQMQKQSLAAHGEPKETLTARQVKRREKSAKSVKEVKNFLKQ